MAEYIPLDIQMEIMKRLRVKSLIQFRTVSKPWKSLIKSSEFIADYNYKQKHHLFVSYYDDDFSNEFPHKFVSFIDDDTFPQQKFTPTVPMSFYKIYNPTIFGSSRGLFCIYSYCYDPKTTTAVIWNPSIRKSVDIVVPNVLDFSYKTVIGFGVCPHTSDPKIVKIVYILDARRIDTLSCIPSQVEVFSLTMGAWRSPSCNNLPRNSIEFTFGQVVIDGFIYWHVNDRRRNVNNDQFYNLIMSFDITNEEYIEVSLPESLVKSRTCLISKLRDSLVELEYNKTKYNKNVFNVYMMEHGVLKSFTKLFTINQLDISIEKVTGFRRSGEMRHRYPDPFRHTSRFVCEPDSNFITNIGISGTRYSFIANSYMETLLLLDH